MLEIIGSITRMIATVFFVLAIVSYFAPNIGGIIFPFLKEKKRGVVTALNSAIFVLFAVMTPDGPTEFEKALKDAKPATDIVFPSSGEFLTKQGALELKAGNVLRHYALLDYSEEVQTVDMLYTVYRNEQGDTLLVSKTPEIILKVSVGPENAFIRLEKVLGRGNIDSGLFERGSLATALEAQKQAYAERKKKNEASAAAEAKTKEATAEPKPAVSKGDFKVRVSPAYGDFIDNPSDYQGKIVTLSPVFRQSRASTYGLPSIKKSLRDYVGDEVRFTTFPEGGVVIVKIPEGMTVPNADELSPLTVSFRCEEGSQGSGNVAVAIKRAR